MAIQWSLVLFTAIAGAGAWLFACVGVSEFKAFGAKVAWPASIVALVLLVFGGFASLSHLSHPERVFGALGHPTSGIFTEALLVGLTALCVIVYMVLLKRKTDEKARKVLAVAGIVLAVVFTFACGSSYMMASRATWNNVALPLGYLGAAAASGCSLYLLMCAIVKDDDAIGFAGLAAAGAGAAATVLSLVYGCVSNAAFGSDAPVFWVAVVVCGGLVPAVCGWLARKGGDKTLAYAAIACAGGLAGSIAFRAVMWMVGTAVMNCFGITL